MKSSIITYLLKPNEKIDLKRVKIDFICVCIATQSTESQKEINFHLLAEPHAQNTQYFPVL